MAGYEAIVLLPDTFRQFKLGQMMQELPDAMSLKVGSPRIPDQNFGAAVFDTAVQPSVKAVGEGLIVEHVTQEDQVEAGGI